MKELEVVYSPLYEGNGAFLGKLRDWLKGTDYTIKEISYEELTEGKTAFFPKKENCFIDVYFEGQRIDTAPLHRAKLYQRLGITGGEMPEPADNSGEVALEVSKLRELIFSSSIQFCPITKENYRDEMTMCMNNHSGENPPEQYHSDCLAIKGPVFEEVFTKSETAGIYAKYKDQVIGRLEVFPREILKKYGFITGNKGCDEEYLTVGCYEVGYGVPGVEMIDELMYRLLQNQKGYDRKYLEGAGAYECSDGFNPYWVYDKYGFTRTEKRTKQIVILEKQINL